MVKPGMRAGWSRATAVVSCSAGGGASGWWCRVVVACLAVVVAGDAMALCR